MHTDYASARASDAFRRAHVQYIDDAGNAWLEFGDVLVDVRGRPRPAAQPATRATGNLFSRSRAQVVLALLAWPELWDGAQRDVAHAAGISLGQAHNTLSLLGKAGYGPAVARSGRSGLLDLWSAAFPSGLAQQLTLATFRGDAGSAPQADDVTVAISGETAMSDVLRPATATIYVTHISPRLAIINRWRADGVPNITVRKQFWNDPTDHHALTASVVAPWPLVYADLRASENPRVRDAAQQWPEQHERS